MVSLVPSITETLLAWGASPLAVTRFCEAPDGVSRVGGTKNPDVDAIVALAPDLVIMDQEENRREDAEALERAGVTVHATTTSGPPRRCGSPPSRDSGLGVGPTLPASTRQPASMGRPGRLDVTSDHLAGIRAGSRQLGHPAQAQGLGAPIWRRPWMSIGGRRTFRVCR